MTDEQKQAIEQQIEKETALIEELEAFCPEWHPEKDKWHEDNREFAIHHIRMRDAYWRRRMLQTKLEGGDLTQTAQVY